MSWRSRIVTALVMLMLAFPLIGNASLRAAGTPDAASSDATAPVPLETIDTIASPTPTASSPSTATPESSMTPMGPPQDPLGTSLPTSPATAPPGANAGMPLLTIDGYSGDFIYPVYANSDITVQVAHLAPGQEVTFAWSEYDCPGLGWLATRYGPFVADTRGDAIQVANVGTIRFWSIQAQTSDGTWSNCVTVETQSRPAPPTAPPTGETDVAFDAYRYTLPKNGSFTASLTIDGRGEVSPRQMVITTDTAWGHLGSTYASARGDGAMQCTLVERDDRVIVQFSSTGSGACTIVSVWAVEIPDPRMFVRQGDLFATEWIGGNPTQRAWSRIVTDLPPASTPIPTETPVATVSHAEQSPEPAAWIDSTEGSEVSALPNTGAWTNSQRGNGIPGPSFWLLGALLLGGSAILAHSHRSRTSRSILWHHHRR